jgi:hypothetical protein
LEGDESKSMHPLQKSEDYKEQSIKLFVKNDDSFDFDVEKEFLDSSEV